MQKEEEKKHERQENQDHRRLQPKQEPSPFLDSPQTYLVKCEAPPSPSAAENPKAQPQGQRKQDGKRDLVKEQEEHEKENFGSKNDQKQNEEGEVEEEVEEEKVEEPQELPEVKEEAKVSKEQEPPPENPEAEAQQGPSACRHRHVRPSRRATPAHPTPPSRERGQSGEPMPEATRRKHPDRYQPRHKETPPEPKRTRETQTTKPWIPKQ